MKRKLLLSLVFIFLACSCATTHEVRDIRSDLNFLANQESRSMCFDFVIPAYQACTDLFKIKSTSVKDDLKFTYDCDWSWQNHEIVITNAKFECSLMVDGRQVSIIDYNELLKLLLASMSKQ